MTIKEFILMRVQLFFFLVTMILAASFFVGITVAPEQELYYQDLISPIIMAGLCILPTCVTYFKKEPTIKQYVFRLVLQLGLIEGILLTVLTPPSDTDKLVFYITIGVIIFVIYVIAVCIFWFQKYRQSQKLTQQLKNFQINGSK